jgi:hypothetical protein
VIKSDIGINVSIINIHYRGPELDNKLFGFNYINLYDNEYIPYFNIEEFVHSIQDIDPNAEFIINTLTLNSFSKILEKFDFVFYSWVHELEISWKIAGEEEVKNQLNLSNKIIVDSNEIRKHIVDYGILKETAYLENGISYVITTEANTLRRNFNVRKNDIFVTIAGSRSIRKGYDLFPYFILRLNEFTQNAQNDRKIVIFWIGAIENIDLNYYVTKQVSEIRSSNIDVRILHNVVNYENYINASDFFVSLAREDSAPQTLALARILGVSSFTLTDLNNSAKNYYDAIDQISKKIALTPYTENNGGHPIGNYNTWKNYWSELRLIIDKETR